MSVAQAADKPAERQTRIRIARIHAPLDRHPLRQIASKNAPSGALFIGSSPNCGDARKWRLSGRVAFGEALVAVVPALARGLFACRDAWRLSLVIESSVLPPIGNPSALVALAAVTKLQRLAPADLPRKVSPTRWKELVRCCGGGFARSCSCYAAEVLLESGLRRAAQPSIGSTTARRLELLDSFVACRLPLIAAGALCLNHGRPLRCLTQERRMPAQSAIRLIAVTGFGQEHDKRERRMQDSTSAQASRRWG